jgi:hypothetical protein
MHHTLFDNRFGGQLGETIVWSCLSSNVNGIPVGSTSDDSSHTYRGSETLAIQLHEHAVVWSRLSQLPLSQDVADYRDFSATFDSRLVPPKITNSVQSNTTSDDDNYALIYHLSKQLGSWFNDNTTILHHIKDSTRKEGSTDHGEFLRLRCCNLESF